MFAFQIGAGLTMNDVVLLRVLGAALKRFGGEIAARLAVDALYSKVATFQSRLQVQCVCK
jgi:hypothetical protein